MEIRNIGLGFFVCFFFDNMKYSKCVCLSAYFLNWTAILPSEKLSLMATANYSQKCIPNILKNPGVLFNVIWVSHFGTDAEY